MEIGKFVSLLLFKNASVKRLTDYTINVGMAVSQSSDLILDAPNSPSGFCASVTETVYLAKDLVRTVQL